MIELSQVAYFVHDDIERELLRQRRYFVIEIEIAFGRAATPSTPRGADADAIVGDAVEAGKSRACLMRQVVRGALQGRDIAAREADDSEFISLQGRGKRN